MTANKISLEYTQEMDNVTCIQQWELANLGSRVEERLFTANLVVLLNLNHVLFNQNMKTQTLNFRRRKIV